MCTGIYSSLSGVILDSGGVTRYVYSCMHVLTCLYMFVCAAAISVHFKVSLDDSFASVKERACANTAV